MRRVAVVVSVVSSLAAMAASAAAQTPPPPAVFVTPAEVAQFLESGIAKSAVDQPIKGVDVHGGRAMVAMLHRDRAETGGLIHERVTETYYILHGSGTLVTGGSLGDTKPNDLTRLGAGPSIQGTRQGGESRKVGPGDIVVIPAGTPHGFSELAAPISYLVFRFDPGR